MNKNDKIIAIAGVIILIIAGIGVYVWEPSERIETTSSIESFLSATSSFSQTPRAITVSDANPFFPLIATPLAAHYSPSGEQTIVPLYIQNISNPSKSVIRAMDDQIKMPVDVVLDDTRSAEEWSIHVATTYWSHSDAALLIQNDEHGYTLGVMATPLASYLSIPIFITDGIGTAVQSALFSLGVKMTLVCGDNIGGYGRTLRFHTIDDIVEQSIYVIEEKFGDVNYLTITNPKDAWPPEVLDSITVTLGPKTMETMSTTYFITAALKPHDTILGTFTIPKDYKNALIKFKGINLNIENVDDLGDNVIFFVGPQLEDLPRGIQKFEVYAGGTSMGGVPIRDPNGNIIEDSTYNEAVVYGRGGVTYQVEATPTWLASAQGDVAAEITIEKLNTSLYPMMKSLSTIAPYLTAYHRGLIFGKPEFAFTANDDTLYRGQPCPGDYMPRRNPLLATASNNHVFWIHGQINNLLARLAGITLEKDRDLKQLHEHYFENPLYIALVGDATMLPQILYDTTIEPIALEGANYFWGVGCPSDFIYGNIDPTLYDWSGRALDVFTEYPQQENIIGRITGWDAQDASALIARNIFYTNIIDSMGKWKDTALVQLGGGNDFQKPFLRYKLFGEILGVIPHGDPMKMETGASYINGLALEQTVKSLGFETTNIRENAAGFQGFSDQAIDKIKRANILNRLLLSKRQLRNAVGEDVVQGKTLQENSNFILANAHGSQVIFTMGDVGVDSLGLGLPRGVLPRILAQFSTIFGVGPGMALAHHMYYNPRNVETMSLGPSFLWIESCITGKIDGMYPKQSITQAFLHSGCAAVVAATTTSSIPGGYLEPKRTHYDFPGQTLIRYLQWSLKARQGVYPDQHFGFKLYTDTLEQLKKGDVSLGLAFREARNKYLPEDADWEVWWSPPLFSTGMVSLDESIRSEIAKRMSSDSKGLDPRLDNKFQAFFEYHIYGDPAFIPYIPIA